MLSDLTDASAVERALNEFDELGRDSFLAKYGFGKARNYFVVRDGRRYDSKAIVGAAHGFQHPDRGTLRNDEFSGGEDSVKRTLERLGFVVEPIASAPTGTLSELLVAASAELRLRHEGDSRFDAARLSSIIQKAIPEALIPTLGDNLKISGRVGIGTAADVPWVGLFLSSSEGSAQQGFYLVYLFAKDGSSIALSLNQGTEQVRARPRPTCRRRGAERSCPTDRSTFDEHQAQEIRGR
jgi:hypothetical protein